MCALFSREVQMCHSSSDIVDPKKMTQSQTDPDHSGIARFVILTLCSLALILPGYFSVYAPAVSHLNHIVKTTEQLFLPPTNETVTCGTVDCLEITY